MNHFIKSTAVQIELRPARLKASWKGADIELPLERGNDGRLTASCREALVKGLKTFINKKPLQSRPPAICAISGMGVSLRRLKLPAPTTQDFEQMLRLQIEAEFPLSPDELAWGYRALESADASTREVLIAAVKKEIIEDYAQVLTGAGMEPQFTLSALARSLLIAQPGSAFALLDVGAECLEWCVFEKGAPNFIRMLPMTAEVSVLDSVFKLTGGWSGRKIYLTGGTPEFAASLTKRFDGGIDCVFLPSEGAVSAALLGLKKAVEAEGATQLLLLQSKAEQAGVQKNSSRKEWKPWLARAAALLGLLLFLPYAEALVLKPFLVRKLAALQADKGRLATIDQELAFLQSLKQSQPPYLDALFLMAKSAPPNTRFESLTMDHRGDVSLQGVMQNGTQVTDFRAKLIASGFFSAVSVDEQNPTPDRQRVNLRMSARWKPYEARASLTLGPTTEEIQQAKTNGTAAPPGMMP